jgi:ABC-type transport system substrate-binding protein
MKKYILIVIAVLTLFFFTVSCTEIDPMLDLGFKDIENTKEVEDPRTAVEIMNEERFLNFKNRQQNKNPLNNRDIRKAIMHAIDRERIVEELYGDKNEVLNSLFNENWEYFNDSWQMYDYDVEKAAQYLEKAGYGLENPLYLTIGTSENSPMRKDIQNIIIENLLDIGIETWVYNSPPVDWYTDSVRNGKYELGLWSLSSSSIDEIKRYFSSDSIPLASGEERTTRNNFYWYSNPEVDELFRGINNIDDKERKIGTMASIQDLMAEDAFMLPLFNRLYTVAYNSRIENIRINPDNGFFLDSVQDWVIDGQGSLQEEETVIALSQEPYSLNPFLSDLSNVRHVNSLVLKGLWERDENGEHVPFLLRSFENMGEDTSVFSSLSIKLVLRDNIFWQDGTPITTEDIKATFDALKQEDYLPEQYKEIHKIKSIEIINEKECVVIFEEVFKDWKSNFEVIIPAFLLEENKIGELFISDIFSCGPYRLKEWTPSHMLFELNEYYIGKSPSIRNIRIMFNDEMSLLLPMLEEEEIDIMYIPADSRAMKRVEDKSNLELIIEKSDYWEQLALCLKPKE